MAFLFIAEHMTNDNRTARSNCKWDASVSASRSSALPAAAMVRVPSRAEAFIALSSALWLEIPSTRSIASPVGLDGADDADDALCGSRSRMQFSSSRSLSVKFQHPTSVVALLPSSAGS
eukprot:scaffold7085_cov329-Pinguiococcus_pyrenoidosus.AAC.3